MPKLLSIFLILTVFVNAQSIEDMKAETHKKEDRSLPYRWTKIGEGQSPAMVVFLHGAGGTSG